MPTLGICDHCGAEIAAASPHGLCTRCLFQLGLGADALTEVPEIPVTNDSGVTSCRRPGTATESAPGSEFETPRQLGDYELLEEIARGGMGVVYRARQRSLDRIVAVKVILVGSFATREQVLRFRAEAEAAARLRHPGIVAIHETGEADGCPFFSMDFMPGGNLTELVRERPLPARDAALLVKKIAEAVHYAHEEGILHRDLKPTNVLLDQFGEPRITDFGVAKRMQEDEFLTVTGQVLGSPNFMPPEQASGRIGGTGRASDVYSIGGILFYLVTGRAPFVAATVAQALQQVLNSEPVSPRLLNPAVPTDIATICLKCLEKDPSRRYRTAGELAQDLGRFAADEPIHARPVSSVERGWRWCRRNRALAGSLALGFVLLLAVSIGSPIAAVLINRARNQARAESYAYSMRLAQLNPADATKRLNDQRPAKRSERDLRGWEWRYLWQQSRSHELFTFGRHNTDVRAVAISADGLWLASGDYRGQIKLWDVATRTEVASCQSGLLPVRLRFSADGQQLVSAGWEHPVHRWTVPDLKPIGPPLAKGTFLGMAVQEERILAIWFNEQKLVSWDLRTGREIDRQPIFQARDQMAVFSHDGRLWAGASNRCVTVNEIQTGRQLIALPSVHLYPDPIDFSPDGRLLAGGGSEGTIEIWDLDTGRKIAELEGHENSVANGRFSPDGRFLATASFDRTIRLWDMSTLSEVTTLRGHEREVYSVIFHPDGQKLVSASADGTIRFWSIHPRNEPNRHHTLPADLKLWSLSPDGRWLFLLNDTEFRLLNLQTLEESPPQAIGPDIVAAALLPGGQRVAVADSDGHIRLMRTDEPSNSSEFAIVGAPILKLAVSADEKVLAAESGPEPGPTPANWTVRAWRLDTRREFARVKLQDKTMGDRLPLSRDGRFLLTPYHNGLTEIWDLRNLGRISSITNERLYITGAAFFRDGRRVATCSFDGTARVRDLVGGREHVRGFSDLTGLRSVAISHDERRLAAGDDLGRTTKVKLWDIASGLEVAALSGHRDSITDIAFWDDGNTIVSVSRDVVLVWTAPSFEEIAKAEAVSRDGHGVNR